MSAELDDQNVDDIEDALFHTSHMGTAIVRRGQFLRVNDELARILGRPVELLEGAPVDALDKIPAELTGPTRQPLRLWYSRRYIRPDGASRTLHIERVPLAADDTDTALLTVVDVTAQGRHGAEAIDQTRAVMLRAVDSMSDGFVVFDPDDRVVLCNRVYASTLEGFDDSESLVGVHVEEIIRRQIASGQPVPAEFAGDVERWVAERLAQHRSADGQPHVQELSGGRWVQSIRHRTPDGGIVVLRSDISAYKHNELAARLQAQYDHLTELPNRRLLHDRLTHALARARRAGAAVAVMLIDLDDFKPVNDTHGHRVGDEVLRVTASRLRAALRSADTVARYGGDEFVVVIDDLRRVAHIGEVTTKVIDAVERPIPLTAGPAEAPALQISCSVGISLFPQDGQDTEVLIRHADAAMYRAKQTGRGRYAYHSTVV